LKKRYGKDPLDVESLVPPLPQPDTERAAEALDLITQCFQAIAEEEARQKEAVEKGKNKSRSLFFFGGGSKRSDGAEGEVDTVPGQRAFIYNDEEEEELEEEVEEEQDTGDSDAQEGGRTAKTAEMEQDDTEDSTPAQSKLDLQAGIKQNSQVDVDNTTEKEEEEEVESAARLADWDLKRDAIATMDDASGSAPQMMRSSSRADSVRAVHLADDFKYW